MADDTYSSFRLLRAWLRETCARPLRHVSFWVYFLIAIACLSPIGIWIEAVRPLFTTEMEIPGIITAIFAYFPTIAAGAGMQLILGSNEKYVRAFVMLVAFFCMLLLAPYIIFAMADKGTLSALTVSMFGVTGIFLSWFICWMANASNPNLMDDETPDNAIGGALGNQLQGSKRGFDV